jgi:polysaccharide biosynthesis protein PslA
VVLSIAQYATAEEDVLTGSKNSDGLPTRRGAMPAFTGAPLDTDGSPDVSGLAPTPPPISLPSPRESKAKLRLRLYCTLFALDLSAIVCGFLLADFVRFGDFFAPTGLTLIPLTSVLFGFIAFSGKAYSIEVLQRPLVSVARGVRSMAFTAAALLLIFFSLKISAQMSRWVLLSGVVFSAVFVAQARYIFGQWTGKRHRWNFVREVLILDGFNAKPERGQIVLAAERSGISPFLNDPEAHDRLGRFLAHCDRVILACDPSDRLAWAEVLKGTGVPVEVMTPEFDDLGAISLRQTAGRSCVLIAPGPMGLRDRLLKRAFDLAVAVPALILLSPVLLVAALAIKFTSPGPVFFRQPRIGQANRHFDVLKFRSMRVDASDRAGGHSASRNDARVTAVGGFLRKTSMDELPQLFNVLKGEMSIVGPRPHALASTAEEQLFWEIDDRYWQRGSVKPGMTGLAQIRGYRGATERTQDLTNRLHSDLEYLAEWSVWKDISIVLKTVRVLVHPNAY